MRWKCWLAVSCSQLYVREKSTSYICTKKSFAGSLNTEPWEDSETEKKSDRRYFLNMAFNTEKENSLSNVQMWVY